MTNRIPFNRETTALLVVDMQPDFMPGGPLAVDEGDQLVRPIGELMRTEQFRHCVATQDWHPPKHASFASEYDGKDPLETIQLHGHEQILWPDHCIQGSEGAALHAELPLARFDMIQRKGMNPQVDSYSGFRENWNDSGERAPTGLAGWLRERGVDTVFICGLARDFCVKWTVEDAVDAGFETWLIRDLSRSVDPSGDEALHADLEKLGVKIIESGQMAG